MNKVGIPDADRRFDEYPFQYSGGMRQRIVIADCSCLPTRCLDLWWANDCLGCDHPSSDYWFVGNLYKTSTISQQSLSPHDLGVVASIADKVAVMYAGEIVEYGTVEEVFYDPRHPYTWSLLSSLPQLADDKGDLYSIQEHLRHFILTWKGMPLPCVLTMQCKLTSKKKLLNSQYQRHIGLKLGYFMRMLKK